MAIGYAVAKLNNNNSNGISSDDHNHDNNNRSKSSSSDSYLYEVCAFVSKHSENSERSESASQRGPFHATNTNDFQNNTIISSFRAGILRENFNSDVAPSNSPKVLSITAGTAYPTEISTPPPPTTTTTTTTTTANITKHFASKMPVSKGQVLTSPLLASSSRGMAHKIPGLMLIRICIARNPLDRERKINLSHPSKVAPGGVNPFIRCTC
jgi:hypothetical protein